MNISKHRILSVFCAALLAIGSSGAAYAEGETNTLTIPQTGYTTPVPASYSTPAEHQGTIEWITYGSEDYLNGNAPVQKQASVYLPYLRMNSISEPIFKDVPL